VLRKLHVVVLVLSLLWLNDEQVALHVGKARGFTLMDGTPIDTHTHERRHECLLMSFNKVQKIVRKTHRSKRRNADFFVISVTPADTKLCELHTRGM
jgi:hypothetical protein